LGCCGGFGSRRPQRFADFERVFPRSKFLTCETAWHPLICFLLSASALQKRCPKKNARKKFAARSGLAAWGCRLPPAACCPESPCLAFPQLACWRQSISLVFFVL
jgi:hypothetical protein